MFRKWSGLVLEKLVWLKVDKLPSASFARYMLVEAHERAQYRADCCDMTLHSVGTR